MRLEGIHHITAITGDAPRNVDFYVGLLGLRMVKKTVNFDAPEVYHLYYADERGSPGSVLTFFEFPGAVPGRAGDGMVHRIGWRVGREEALDFWTGRLDGVRAYARDPSASARLLEELALAPEGEGRWQAQGAQRHALYGHDPSPPERSVQGAGSVHHVAFASRDEDHADWRLAATRGGARPTPIIDRQYFRSIYFREPSGVLFEIATLSPGFDVDEPLESLGEALTLPPQHEHLRAQLERTLTPLPAPRTGCTR